MNRLARAVVALSLSSACSRNDVAPPFAAKSADTAAYVASDAGPIAVQADPPRPLPPGARLRFVVATQDSDLLSVIRVERLKAKGEGRTLVVYAGATWCEPCQRFHAAAHAGRLDARLGNTTLLELDADRDGVRLDAAGYSFKFIPYFALPGPDGHATDAFQFRSKGAAAESEMIDLLERWQRGG